MFVICGLAGVMYWGDSRSSLSKIEKAHLNGTGRTVLLWEFSAFYLNFALHDDKIYFTDWLNSRYV